MSIHSIYGSGDDEEEIFRLTDPDEHPDSDDEQLARQEEESISSSGYDDAQGEHDESAERIILGATLQDFSDEDLADVFRLIEEIRIRREGRKLD